MCWLIRHPNSIAYASIILLVKRYPAPGLRNSRSNDNRFPIYSLNASRISPSPSISYQYDFQELFESNLVLLTLVVASLLAVARGLGELGRVDADGRQPALGVHILSRDCNSICCSVDSNRNLDLVSI